MKFPKNGEKPKKGEPNFSGILDYHHREGHALDEAGDPDDHARDAVNVILQYSPGRTGVEFNPPTGQTENHFELSAGYEWAPGLSWFLGWRGFTGPEDSANMLFLGFSTDYRTTVKK